MKIISRGAEAILYQDKEKIIKKRIPKGYRIIEIDEKIRKLRTRQEAKILKKANIAVPKVINFSDADMTITIEFIEGKLLRDYVERINEKELQETFVTIGKSIALLHNRGIIHGDITTSNIIKKNNILYFIDFGLGFFSEKIEDKAVDLHVFRQVLEAKHYKISEKAISFLMQGYALSKDFGAVKKRLEKVENRGRYK